MTAEADAVLDEPAERRQYWKWTAVPELEVYSD